MEILNHTNSIECTLHNNIIYKDTHRTFSDISSKNNALIKNEQKFSEYIFHFVLCLCWPEFLVYFTEERNRTSIQHQTIYNLDLFKTLFLAQVAIKLFIIAIRWHIILAG